MRLNIILIEKIRTDSGLSKARFAKRLGMMPDTYNKMLLAQSTTLSRVSKIADALKVNPISLLTA